MNGRKSLLIILALLTSARIVSADQAMAAWEWMADITPPGGAKGLCSINLTAEVLEQARDDLADLRLLDSNGGEIPFAARVRRDVDETRRINTREFNRAKVAGGIAELTVDLGEGGGTHNEVEVSTSGENFRRQVEVDGSDDGQSWHVLKADAVIFSFEAKGKRIESNQVTYPASQYRYLRARVSRDVLVDRDAPEITGIAVMMSVVEKGESISWDTNVFGPQPVRADGSPASAWTIDLGHRVPCNRLELNVSDTSFSRPFSLESADDQQDIRIVTSGEISRRGNEERKPIVIAFDEIYARRFRLIVTDYANPALTINSMKASAPVRQVLFEMNSSVAPPLRLFAGYPKGEAPRYDFERELPAQLSAQPISCEIGLLQANPNYRPEPKPLTERVPWLIYAVLAVSSLALALILISLVRSAQRGTTGAGDAAAQ
jgi:hypothetical protein